MYQELKYELQHSFFGRNRSEKDRMIVRFLFRKHHLLNRTMTEDILKNLVQEYDSYNRVWRKIMQECPELRGSDYHDKRVLSEKKQLELGYEPRYHQNQKAFKEKLGTSSMGTMQVNNNQKI